ncbi:MAG TPA: PepSY domain-containing protein [Gammaproteobacteria bacterium]
MARVEPRRAPRSVRVSRAAARLCALPLCMLGALAFARPVPMPLPPPVPEPYPVDAVMQRGVTLEQAIAMATRQYPGTVASARTTTRDGRVVHEIRILGERGRVRIVRIDAETGEFL